ncbi:hypothetical protein [Chryseobacterium sp. RR2-3-20]|uniref:hypothetical protein n=1 Tax=Chryseobacterium sp. RR2-3-20 TaxID=2787626 RepID=UPI001ADEF231|nr:hypothetical protein [Chryseobacterium sp. RR2-3-20]
MLTWFEPATKETANKFYNTSQIAVRLAELGNLHVTDGTVNKLGKALKKHGFQRYSKNHAYVYPVKEFDFDEVDKRNRSMETTDKQGYTTQEIPYRFEN